MTRRTNIGTYTVTPNGTSKALNCMKALDGFDFPSELGEEMQVILVEDGDNEHLRVVPADE